jgi:drug/metabolite transporter (DMT)-like permease
MLAAAGAAPAERQARSYPMTDSTVSSRDYFRAVLVVLGATAFWSLSGVFVRWLPTELSGWQINAYRGLSAGFALLAYLVIVYGRDTWRRFRAIEPMALAATVGFFSLGSTFYVISLTLTGTANVACLTATSPIFAAILSPLVTRERPGAIAWVAAAIALAGVVVVVGGEIRDGANFGSLVALFVAFCFAGQTVVLRRFREVDMVPAICVGGFVIFALIAPVLLVAPVDQGLDIGWRSIGVITVMGLVQLALPLTLYTYGARYLPAVPLTLIALLDVVFNPFWAWLGVGERPAEGAYWGGSLIVLAVAASVIAGRRAARAVPETA